MLVLKWTNQYASCPHGTFMKTEFFSFTLLRFKNETQLCRIRLESGLTKLLFQLFCCCTSNICRLEKNLETIGKNFKRHFKQPHSYYSKNHYQHFDNFFFCYVYMYECVFRWIWESHYMQCSIICPFHLLWTFFHTIHCSFKIVAIDHMDLTGFFYLHPFYVIINNSVMNILVHYLPSFALISS